MRWFALMIAVLVILQPAPARGAGEGISLAPRFEAGTRHHYISSSVIRHDVAADLLEEKQEVTVRTESGMSIVVSEVGSNGEAELLWTIHYMVLGTDGVIPGMEQALDYDSREPGAGSSPLGPTLSRLLAKPISIRVDRGGTVLSFTAPQVDAVNDAVGQLAQNFFSQEAFSQLPLFITQGAPATVKVRETWNRRQQVAFPLGGVNLELQQAFTCARLNPRQKSARLTMTGTIAAVTAGPPAVNGLDMLQGATLTVESGDLSGEYEWEFTHGRLLTAESRLDLATVLDTRVGKMQLKQHLTGSVDLVDERAFERKARAKLRSSRGAP